jgi:hypothetical protein
MVNRQSLAGIVRNVGPTARDASQSRTRFPTGVEGVKVLAIA